MTTTTRRWDGPGLDAWQAWTPREAATVLEGVDAPWCVVGGWAIDLWLGEVTRPHEDLEIAIPHAAFSAMRRHLRAYTLFSVGDGEVLTLADDADQPADKHQAWVLDVAANRWRMDVMQEPGDAHTWAYRRDPSIALPRAAATLVRDGIPYLAPQCALLFKAKHMRAKDVADFGRCAPTLDSDQRDWLRDALTRTLPDHPWIADLEGPHARR